MRNSSRTLKSREPLSTQWIVDCRISSSRNRSYTLKRASNEFGVPQVNGDSMAGKAVSLRSLLANQSGEIYRQNFEADVFPSGAVNL
ncbi:hypothetical protein TNCV_5132451 [Trichonephila clavipes]|nr:hypothetical protein TNCV_5132451 [Trichonephila clavipes]